MDGELAGVVDALVVVLILLCVGICVIERRALAAIWFQREDPRTLALFRIVTGVLLVVYLAALEPLHLYLFTDEGLFLTDTAGQVHASTQFAGYGARYDPSSPRGFFDVGAFLTWLSGPKYSLLHLWDSPAVFRVHLWAYYLACASLTVGLVTPVTRWVTLALFVSIMYRTHAHWAGEAAYTGFLFPLCLSRCGEVWSVDAWWRRRRGIAERAIPSWPRLLMILQATVMFGVNGLHKTGQQWQHGDALYYLLEHAQLGRFEIHGASAVFGTNLYRLATWTTLVFEVFFPLVVVGLVIRDARRLDVPRPLSRLALRACWIGVAATITALAWTAWDPPARRSLPFVALHGVAATIVVAAVVRPRVPGGVLRWVLGRRLWVTLAVVFSTNLVVFTAVGNFTHMAVVSALVFFRGEDLRRGLAWIRRGDPPTGPSSPVTELAGRWRRRAIASLCAFHVLSVAWQLLPRDDPPSSIRAALDRPANWWIATTMLYQGWRMFAPNGPNAVVDLRARVVTHDGNTVDLGRGFYADPDFAAGPAWDKVTKIARRFTWGEDSPTHWYVKWHARHICRAWALRHGGRPPREVRLYRLVTRIPPPAVLAEDRHRALAFDRERRRETQIDARECATDFQAQLPPEILERHGLDPAGLPPFRPWLKHRQQKWTGQPAVADPV